MLQKSIKGVFHSLKRQETKMKRQREDTEGRRTGTEKVIDPRSTAELLAENRVFQILI